MSEPTAEQLRQILDAMTEPVCRFRPDGTLLFVNAAYCAFFAKREQDVLGSKYAPTVHPDDLERVEAEVSRISPEHPRVVIENRVVLDSGEIRYTQWTNVGFFDAHGQLVELQAACRDITGRVHAEQELARQTDRFRFLAEASRVLNSSLEYATTLARVANLAVPYVADGCSVSVIDAQGDWERVAVANVDPEQARRAEATASRTDRRRLAPGLKQLSDLLLAGESILVPVLTDEDLEKMSLDEETLREAKEAQTQSYMIVPLVTHDRVVGAIIFTSSRRHSKRTFGDADLELAEELARRAAQAIENAHLVSELRDQDARKDRFFATLGHELRNPLAALSHALEVLDADVDDDAARAQALAVAKRQVRHQARLVEDLLDVARLRRGAVTLRRTTIDARVHVRNAVETHRGLADRKRQSLVLDETSAEALVSADPARLEQIVGNLIDNAIKYSPAGATVRVAIDVQDGAVQISVVDDGPGIPDELRGRIFDPFVQGESTHDQPSAGLGIGLTIVRQLVDLHGGALDVRAGPKDRGTEVTVTLARMLEEREEARRATPAGPVGPMRVLVVDDNADAADMLASLLLAWGHEARAVYSGEAAITAARETQPDLVMIDIGMPGMNGYETARALRNEPAGRRARLVAVTGYAHSADVAAALEAGFDRHLAKPVDGATLGKLLAEGPPFP